MRAQHGHVPSDPPCHTCGPEPPPATRYRAISLDDPTRADGHARLIELLVDSQSADPEREIIRREDLSYLGQSMSCLNDKERAVISLRFGLAGGRIYTLKEIGSALSLSRERVRQIEMAARRKLRLSLHRARVPSALDKRAGLHSRTGSRAATIAPRSS